MRLRVRVSQDLGNYSFETSQVSNSILVRLLPRPCPVLSYSGSNEIFQGLLIDLVTFMEVNCPGFLSLKPSIEELVRVQKICALKEVHFHISLESTRSYDQSVVGPHRCVPFPLLSDLGVNIVNDLAKPRDHQPRQSLSSAICLSMSFDGIIGTP